MANDKLRLLYDVLKRISSYASPDRLRRIAEREYGLTGDDAVEMAYENVLEEAKAAIKGMRRPRETEIAAAKKRVK